MDDMCRGQANGGQTYDINYAGLNSLGAATPLGIGNSSGGRAMIAALGKNLGTANQNLLSTGGGNPLYSNFMVEVDEFKFNKIMVNVIEKTRDTVVDELTDFSDEETDLSIEDDQNQSVSSKNPAEQSKDQSKLTWLESQEIFGILDAGNIETVGFREFCAMTFLVAAVQSNQML